MNRRGQGVARVLRLLTDLRAGSRGTLADFAARHGVCARTIRRDFAVLAEVGYPVCRTPEDGPSMNGEPEQPVFWMAPETRKRSVRTTGPAPPRP